MTGSADQVTSRARLGKELRRLREQAGKTLDEVAARLDCSAAKLSRIETGQVAVRPPDLREMLDCYRVLGARQTALLSVARGQRQRDWWRTYADIIFDGYDHYVGYEEEATEIREYQPSWIPGLLQTREYAHALALAYGSTEDEAERLAELRHARQAILRRANPPRLSVVIDETALRRPAPGIMGPQLESLIARAAAPDVTVRVLPLAAGMHPAQSGGFIVLGFADPEDPEVAYTNNLTEAQLIHDPDRVARYVSTFDRVGALALGPAESAEFIAEIAGTHR
ncbi:Helix-turn-helix domain-containing protein [Amycolatopsis xylanica]|uniref:Helix-turn-helix domain-containing protein n=1 Tax=Amycolatopsis xylanica TaxID=589385 RepID=A0A1H3PN45_9PSEU|nr:helix-turn-helix transcriptional regulator [Amycolatopsis xylanica]SDZ02350.1 Helix-turn-helix domain-containing protein [Amycolatopsis xylanica]